ncbi:MAG: BatD family protein [Phycisphaerales bacterium]|nr:BatD family protein [Phycisphaerales bacterium]
MGIMTNTPRGAASAWARLGPTAARRLLGVVVLFAVAVLAVPGLAADVSWDLSPRETYVGAPVVLSIRVDNATEQETPEPPVVDGAEVMVLTPSRMSSFSNINGRTSQTLSITYRYSITPTRPGEIVVPSVRVVADGQTFDTREMRIAVSPSETGDLLMLEVVASRDQVYVGERVDLTLRIWMKPYADSTYKVRIDPPSMWAMIDWPRSRWGVFEPALRALAERNQQPTGREATAPGKSPDDPEHYLFELRRSVWPVRSGALDLGGLTVAMQYPLRLEMSQTLLSRRLGVAESRPVTASLDVAPVTVKPLPTVGMPVDFRGAVGTFDVVASVDKSKAAVGVPMTLTLTVNDRTPGGADLSAMAAPPLALQADLTRDFKVPSEPLAGEVVGRSKVFTQTIRPLRTDVTRIPPIRFSAFDPGSGRYVQLETEAIPITVHGSERLAVTDVVGPATEAATPTTELEEVKGGILANYALNAEALRDDGASLGTATMPALLLPPIAYAFVLTLHWHRERHRRDPTLARRSGARRRASEALAASGSARDVRTALVDYVASALARPPGAVTRSDAVSAVREANLDDRLVGELSSILETCERLEFASDGAIDPELPRRAEAWMNAARLERRRGASVSPEVTA